MDPDHPSVNAVVQWERREQLKDVIPWLLPTASALGGFLVYAAPPLRATAVHFIGFLPPRLASFWFMAIFPAWLCLVLACSSWTAFRYTRALSDSPGKAAIRGMLLTPVICLMHLLMASIVTYIVEALFGFRL